MPTKIGAGDNPQEYDKNTGRYAKGTSNSDNGDKDFFRTAERTIEREKKTLSIDFERDNYLPPLNKKELTEIGLKDNKKVLLKKAVIDRNALRHPDITKDNFSQILTAALYSPSEIFLANDEKPYYHFAKIMEIKSQNSSDIGLVLLDVDNKKDNFEIVHVHYVNIDGYRRLKNKNKKDN